MFKIKNKIIGLLLIFTLLFVLVSSLLQAKEQKIGFKEWGVGVGFLMADLKDKRDLNEIALSLHWGRDLRTLLKNKSHHLMEFVVEPYASLISSPRTNFKGGCNFLLKWGIPLSKKIVPFIQAGAGMSYFTLQTRQQSTQFNFTEVLSTGISYFVKENISVNLEYRYQHLSNASMRRPNRGIDSQGFNLSFSLYY